MVTVRKQGSAAPLYRRAGSRSIGTYHRPNQLPASGPRPIPFRHSLPCSNPRRAYYCDISDDIAEHENIASNPDQEYVNPHNFDDTKEPVLENIEKNKIVSFGVSEDQPQISSSMQEPAQVHQIDQTHRHSFTPGQISSAISASENIRTCCSVAAAILVILSCVKFPILGGHIIRSVLISKLLYMLLLTNISIVVGRLDLGKKGAGRTSNVAKFSGNGLVDQMGKAFELGLLLQKISGAMFIDFGVYVIVLISLVQRIGC